jgi:hypothetical protein
MGMGYVPSKLQLDRLLQPPHMYQPWGCTMAGCKSQVCSTSSCLIPPLAVDCRIIASMHHKLTFLRNPRYPTTPALKALQSQFIPGPEWGESFGVRAGLLSSI